MDNNSILEKITEQYSAGMAGSKRASSIRKKIEQGTATYAQAEEMARECSRQLNRAFRDNLPDAVNNNFLYRETAEVVVRKPINQTAGDVADAAKKIQAALNEQAEIGMNPIVPELNEDQVDGIITGICNQPYSTGQNEFFSQVENLMEGYVDDFVHDNADFQYEAGLSPTIERTAVGKCCKWCDNLTGVYPYEKVQNPGNDVFRRHKNCHCQVLYNPGEGSKRRQNVHNRQWTDGSRTDRIALSEQPGDRIVHQRFRNSDLPNGLPLRSIPNSISDKLADDGTVLQRRKHGPDGMASVDYDTNDHGESWKHPEGAHKHIFDYSGKKPKRLNAEMTEQDLIENADIIIEGVNYHAKK